MEGRVRPLRTTEIGAASHLLARAFVDDPFIGFLLPSDRRRGLAFPPFFRAVLHPAVELGSVWAFEAEDDIRGVAAWFPPDPAPAGRNVGARARANLAAVQCLFPRAARPLLGAFAGFEAHHPAVPHWYLAFIGVAPDAQGRGIGQALLDEVLRVADTEGTPCYLETPYPQTHHLYRRNGFAIEEELHPVAGGPPVWTMTRLPTITSASEVQTYEAWRDTGG